MSLAINAVEAAAPPSPRLGAPSAKLTSDEDILVALCGLGLSTRGGTDFRNLAAARWSHVAQLAERHRVTPLIGCHLSSTHCPDIPPEVVSAFQHAYYANAGGALRHAAHIGAIQNAFTRAGIPSAALKGVAVAASWYSDIGARFSADIDILVDKTDLRLADELLKELGYIRISNQTKLPVSGQSEDLILHHHFTYMHRNGVYLELHFSLHPNPCLLPIDLRELELRIISIPPNGISIATLPEDLQFLFLATHGARHKWKRLQWIYDIAICLELSNSSTIEELLSVARAYGITKPVVQALIIADRFFDLQLPSDVVALYHQSKSIRFLVRCAEKAVFNSVCDEPDDTAAGFSPQIRFYRMCMSSRLLYHWNEASRGLWAAWNRAVALSGGHRDFSAKGS